MRRRFMPAIVLVILATSATGCAVLAPGTGYRGGSATLTEAIDAARADTARKVRRLDAGESRPPARTCVVDHDDDDDDDAPATFHTEPRRHPGPAPLFGFVAGASMIGGMQHDRLGAFGIGGGNFDSGRDCWEVHTTVGPLAFDGASPPANAFRHAIDLGVDAAYRQYVGDPHANFAPFLTAGAGTGTVFWEYVQPVPVVRDGDARAVRRDRLNHYDAFAGLGASLLQGRKLRLGASLVGGLRVYGGRTFEGFRNDAIPTVGFARVMLELHSRL